MRRRNSTMWNRRLALTGGLAAVGSLYLPRIATAAVRPALAPLATGVSLVTGTGTNTIIYQPKAGGSAVIVDPGSAQTARALAKLLATPKGAAPLVINTHWHPEQTAANDFFGKAGSKIVAHENTRLWMSTTFSCPWRKQDFKPRAAAARPTETFYEKQVLTIDGAPLECGYMLQAHTDGDIYVYLRDANVLLVGDVAAGGAYPITDYCTNGWISAMVTAQNELLAIANADTRIVAGVGAVMTRAEFQAQRDMMVVVRDRLFDLVKKGYSPDELVAAKPTQDFDAQYGNPELMIRNAARGMADNARMVPGVV